MNPRHDRVLTLGMLPNRSPNLPLNDTLGERTDSYKVASCPPAVPYRTQHAALIAQLADGPDALCDFVREQWPQIRRLALERFDDGYAQYGSAMYAWDAETWAVNMREEAADLAVYMSRGKV